MYDERVKEILGFDPDAGSFHPSNALTLGDDVVQDLPDIEKFFKLHPWKRNDRIVRKETLESFSGQLFVVEKETDGEGEHIRRSYYQRMHYGNFSSSFELMMSLWLKEENGHLEPKRLHNKSGVLYIGKKSEFWLCDSGHSSRFCYSIVGLTSFSFFRPDLDFAEVDITFNQDGGYSIKHGPPRDVQYDIKEEGPMVSIMRVCKGFSQDAFVSNRIINLQKVISDSVDAEVIDNPVDAPAYLDILWREMDLPTALNVQWRIPSKRD